MVLVCGTKGPDMKEKGGDDEDDVTPAPANSDPVDDEVMHLDGYEIGSKRILAEIEEHAFDDPPAAPRPSRPFTVSAEVRRPIAALESDTRSEEHTSELQPLIRTSYAVFCWKNTKNKHT